MKRLLLTTIIVLISFAQAQAQAETVSFTVSGIKVIFKPTTKNVINIRIYYRGGVNNYAETQAGIENLALDATTQCGTKKYSANAFRDTADKYGVYIYGRSTYDYGFIQVNCISKYFEKGWDLFSEAVTDPVFDAGQVELIKSKQISYISRKQANAQNQLFEVQMKNAFAKTAYAVSPDGTEQTIAGLTADGLNAYYKTLLNKNRIFIVVVGNVKKEDLYEKILLAFDNIRSAPYTDPVMTAPLWNDNKLLSEEQQVKTNYVSAIMNAPAFTSEDYVPFRLAVSGLGGNLYSYLRSVQNLTYDPSSSVRALKMPFTTVYASSTNPQQVMFGIMKVLKSVQTNGYNDEWLQHIKNGYITNSYINDQSAAQITDNLGSAEILGNWHFADDLPRLVNMVTVDQLNAVINNYIKGLRWNYVGNLDIIEGFKVPKY